MPTFFDFETLEEMELTPETVVYLVRNSNEQSGQEFFNLRAVSPLMFSQLTRDPETRAENYWRIDNALLSNESASLNIDFIFPQNKLTKQLLTRAEIEDNFPGCLSNNPAPFPNVTMVNSQLDRPQIQLMAPFQYTLTQAYAEQAQLTQLILQLQQFQQIEAHLQQLETGNRRLNRTRSTLSAGASALPDNSVRATLAQAYVIQAQLTQLILELQQIEARQQQPEAGNRWLNRARSALSAGASAFRAIFRGFGAAPPRHLNEQNPIHTHQNITNMLGQGRTGQMMQNDNSNTESPNQTQTRTRTQTQDPESRLRSVTRQLFHSHEQRTILSSLATEHGITEKTILELISAHEDAEQRLETILNHMDSFKDLIINEQAPIERLLDLDLDQLNILLSSRQLPERQTILAEITQNSSSKSFSRF